MVDPHRRGRGSGGDRAAVTEGKVGDYTSYRTTIALLMLTLLLVSIGLKLELLEHVKPK